jgi:hypothetical protein
VVVTLFLGSLGQLHLFPSYFLGGNQAEKMRDEVQPRTALMVGEHNLPRCLLSIRGFQHQIPSAGRCIPFAARGQIHRAQLPLPQWVPRCVVQSDASAQGGDAEDPRASGSGNSLDRTAFSRRITPLENDNDAQPFVPHPFLELADFDLKLAQFLFVFLSPEFASLWGIFSR